MPESIIKVFSKEQQDACYNILTRVQYIETDLKNSENFLLQGRFFDAMDLIRQSNINSQLVQTAIVKFVTSLKEGGLWE